MLLLIAIKSKVFHRKFQNKLANDELSPSLVADRKHNKCFELNQSEGRRYIYLIIKNDRTNIQGKLANILNHLLGFTLYLIVRC